MFTRLAAVAGALLVAGAPAMASTNATLEWNGQINRSCSLTARQVGTVVLNGKQASASRLDSTAQGGRPAILGYETVGGGASVGFVSGSVLRNGSEERLVDGKDDLLQIKYETLNQWQTVFQNAKGNWYNNQTRITVDGNGQLDVEARTNAHLDTSKNGPAVVETGSYVVKTVMECIPNRH